MNNKRILLVEDDALLQKLYSDLLTGEQFFVETASDGLTAYEKMKQGGWDLVLLDILLPELDGIEIVSGLVGFVKNKTIEKADHFNPQYFLITILISGVIGAVSLMLAETE